MQHHIRMFRFPLALLIAALPVTGCDDGDDPSGLDDLTDGQIVAIAMALNAGEVMTSESALENAESEAVLGFAEIMVGEHSAALDIFESFGITPVQNSVSQQLTQRATQLTQTLNQLEGSAFDDAYMAAQVELHETALDYLDELIDEAEDDELESFLEEMRGAVAAHLEMAEEITAAVT